MFWSMNWRDHRGVQVGTIVMEKGRLEFRVEDDFYSGKLTHEESIRLAVDVLSELAPEKLR